MKEVESLVEVIESEKRDGLILPCINKDLQCPAVNLPSLALSKDFIDAHINNIFYFKVEDMYKGIGLKTDDIPAIAANMTYCHIVTNKGQLFEGRAHCVDPRNYNLQIGKERAYNDAYMKLTEYLANRQRENIFNDARNRYLADHGVYS